MGQAKQRSEVIKIIKFDYQRSITSMRAKKYVCLFSREDIYNKVRRLLFKFLQIGR